jgi:hypothetical protein
MTLNIDELLVWSRFEWLLFPFFTLFSLIGLKHGMKRELRKVSSFEVTEKEEESWKWNPGRKGTLASPILYVLKS